MTKVLFFGPPLGLLALGSGAFIVVFFKALVEGDFTLQFERGFVESMIVFFGAAFGFILSGVPTLIFFSYIVGFMPAIFAGILVSLHCWWFARLSLFAVWLYVTITFIAGAVLNLAMSDFHEEHIWDDISFIVLFFWLPSMVAATIVERKMLNELSFRKSGTHGV